MSKNLSEVRVFVHLDNNEAQEEITNYHREAWKKQIIGASLDNSVYTFFYYRNSVSSSKYITEELVPIIKTFVREENRVFDCSSWLSSPDFIFETRHREQYAEAFLSPKNRIDKRTKLTIRGVYGETSVTDHLEAFISAYNFNTKNIHLLASETLFLKEDEFNFTHEKDCSLKQNNHETLDYLSKYGQRHQTFEKLGLKNQRITF